MRSNSAREMDYKVGSLGNVFYSEKSYNYYNDYDSYDDYDDNIGIRGCKAKVA